MSKDQFGVDFSSVSRLEIEQRKGGLRIPKSKAVKEESLEEEEGSGFKVPAPRPRQSLLGLDKLAEEKRKQQGESNGDSEDYEPKVGEKRKRQFRNVRPETPSHPGGVNRDVVDRIDQRRK